MNKKKSIALLVVISVALVVLAVLTFAQFRLPWNDTRIYRSFLGAIELDSDLEEGVAYELTLKEDISVEDTDIEPDEVVLTLERRLEALGYRGAQVTAYRADETENWSFRVEMRSSNTAADDGLVYFCPTFWNSSAREVAAIARYSSTSHPSAESPPAGRPPVAKVAIQERSAVAAN